MKCIHCESNVNYRERSGGRCPRCGHAFAFEPRTDPRQMADGMFLGCIQAVSGKGALFFTERQLYWEVNRLLLRRRNLGCLFGAARKKAAESRAPVIDEATFRTYLSRWVATHGPIEKLSQVPKVGKAVPAELQSYSFDRALIVEHAEIAAMLVANRFHFENNCAILSFDRRFPAAPAFEGVREMLAKNPSLSVFSLHDSSPHGHSVTGSLRSPDWFGQAPGVRLFDIGLRPGQLARNEAMSIGEDIELASLRPARLMRATYLGFSQASQYADGGGVWVDSGYGFFYLSDGYPAWGMGDPLGAGLDGGTYDSFG